jgi:hypothetical protein
MGRHVGMFAVLAGALTLTPTMAEAHVHRFGIHLEASYQPAADRVVGRIDADQLCVDGRRIRMFHIDGDTGRRRLAGVTARPDGDWRVRPERTAEAGDRFRVVVPQEVHEDGVHRHTCRSARLTVRL